MLGYAWPVTLHLIFRPKVSFRQKGKLRLNCLYLWDLGQVQFSFFSIYHGLSLHSRVRSLSNWR